MTVRLIFSDNGGIYLDTDVLALKSLKTLRKYPLTLVPSLPNTVSNGIILTEQNSPYLCLLEHNYYDYTPREFRLNSVVATKKLYDVFPHLVHLGETHRFFKPSFEEKYKLLTDRVDWSDSYLMHIWKHGIGGKIPKGPEEIRQMNNTLGDVMRYVYYGSKDILLN